MTTARKFLSLLLTVTVIVNAFVLTLVVSPSSVGADRLKGARVTLSDSRYDASSTYTFGFTIPTAATIQEIRFQWATASDGTGSPTGLDLSAATLGTLSNLTGWTLATPVGRIARLQQTGGGEAISGNTVVSIPLQAIDNSAQDACQSGGDTSSDTCFITIETDTALNDSMGTTVTDSVVITYTTTNAVTVSATVDPTFTFVISSVGASTVIGGATTSVASTASTIPFGSLTAGTPKYIAQKLNVTTNANSGYTVSMKMVTAMTGTYSANNIDPFAATGATWSSPIAWTEPTGTSANTDTAWIGAYTSDTDVSGFASGLFGPVNATANTVMSSSSSDNGGTSVYVNYAIEANVYQPADTYTGTMFYVATPRY